MRFLIDPRKDHPHAIAYIKQLRNEGQTWQNARSACRHFCRWLATFRAPAHTQPSKVDVERVTATDIQQYLHHSRCKGAYNTTRLRYTYLRGWFIYMLEQEIVLQDPTEGIPGLKRRDYLTDKRHLSREQVAAFLKAVVKYSEHPLHDVALFGLMSGMGLRATEVLRLTVDDVDIVTHELRVRGKGKKDRLLPLAGAIRTVLYKHLEARQSANPGDAVWQIEGRNPLTYCQLYLRFTRFKKLAGLPDGACPHSLRHFCLTQLVEAGHHPELIAKFAGHSSPRELRHYLHLSEEFICQSVQRPFARLFNPELKEENLWPWTE